jgi:Mn2+/Fe2+ NRAMP family transporter
VKIGQIFEVALGIVTSVGGFLEAGSIATAAQAGAEFEFKLIWPIALGTLCLIFLIEMSGRLAAVSHHPLPSAVRDRLGFNFFIIPLCSETIIDYFVLASEIGGACMGLQLLTGVALHWWALPVALLAWLILWFGNFGAIEYGVSLLGLITLVFVVAAVKLHPQISHVAQGLLPSLPTDNKARYWFLVVSILGATISPYLFNFYSSGAVEDKWDEKDLGPNRAVAILGMSFGGLISVAVLVAAACALHRKGIRFDRYEQLPSLVTDVLPRWGYWLVGAGLFIACLGAAIELSLDISYVYAQGFGWNWGENEKPNESNRFSTCFTVFVFGASIPSVLGMDPLKLTLFSMAATAVILPLIVLPFLVLMNNEQFVGKHRNGLLSNSVVFFVILMAFVIALVAIPLEIFGGS